MVTSRPDPSSNARQSARLSYSFTAIADGFVRDDIAREEFNHAFGGADERRDVQTYVNSPGNETFLLDLVPCHAKGKDRPDHRNRFDDSLGDCPATGPDDSAFESGYS